MSKIDPMVFQPFGAGPRNCIGMRFAILEVKMAMCKLLYNFKLETCDDTPVSLHTGIKFIDIEYRGLDRVAMFFQNDVAKLELDYFTVDFYGAHSTLNYY